MPFFCSPFPFRYAPLQRRAKNIIPIFDFIFYLKWVTSIYNAEFRITIFLSAIDKSPH